MSVEIARVAYAYNSRLAAAGEKAYFLDCYIAKEGLPVVDRHESFATREEFLTAMEDVIPALDSPVGEFEREVDESEGASW